jgi:hypothetical protein
LLDVKSRLLFQIVNRTILSSGLDIFYGEGLWSHLSLHCPWLLRRHECLMHDYAIADRGEVVHHDRG